MLKSLQNRRSWVTQRLANRYPAWSRLRKLAQSVGQQLLSAAGREMEDAYWWTNYNLGNYLLNTSDPYQLEGLERLILPTTFTFRTQEDSDAILYIAPELVRGKLSNDTWVTLSQATDNSIEEFWFSEPARITAADESYDYLPVIPSTTVSDLSTVVPKNPSIAGKLWVSLSNNGAAVKNYKGRIARSTIEITGRDIHGKVAKERLKFAFNGTVQTRLAWSEISTITTKYIDSVAQIRIDWLSANQTDFLNTYGLHITQDREKFRFWSILEKSFGTVLQHKVFSPSDFLSVQEGDDVKHAEHEVALFSESNANISASNMVSWPKRRYVILTDGEKLHFFIPDVPTPDYLPLLDKTEDVACQIYTSSEWAVKGDSVSLETNLKRAFIRVHRTRWSVVRPDGKRFGLDSNGNEITYSTSAWTENVGTTREKKMGLGEDPIEYTFQMDGRYTFYLESTISDILSETPRYTDQVDVKIIEASKDIAQKSVYLPVSVGTVSSVGFDAYNRPWVINQAGVAHRLNFHWDTYLADFASKMLYTRDSYESLEVLA